MVYIRVGEQAIYEIQKISGMLNHKVKWTYLNDDV